MSAELHSIKFLASSPPLRVFRVTFPGRLGGRVSPEGFSHARMRKRISSRDFKFEVGCSEIRYLKKTKLRMNDRRIGTKNETGCQRARSRRSMSFRARIRSFLRGSAPQRLDIRNCHFVLDSASTGQGRAGRSSTESPSRHRSVNETSFEKKLIWRW